MEPIFKNFESELIDVDAGKREVVAVITTPAVDRTGEVVLPSGLKRKNYAGAPVFFDHKSNLPLGTVLWVKETGGRLLGKHKFSEKTEFARDMFALAQEGTMKTYSIGFNQFDSGAPTPEEVKQYGEHKKIYRSWELLEYSLVGIPCNPEAVALAVSKGIILAPDTYGVLGIEPVTKSATTELNKAGETHAAELIKAGHINRNGAWGFDSADENALLGPDGDNWDAFSAAHLAVHKGGTKHTRGYYGYPVVKDGQVWLHALKAAESRASQQGATEVADAAKRLFDTASKHLGVGHYAYRMAQALAAR